MERESARRRNDRLELLMALVSAFAARPSQAPRQAMYVSVHRKNVRVERVHHHASRDLARNTGKRGQVLELASFGPASERIQRQLSEISLDLPQRPSQLPRLDACETGWSQYAANCTDGCFEQIFPSIELPRQIRIGARCHPRRSFVADDDVDKVRKRVGWIAQTIVVGCGAEFSANRQHGSTVKY